MTKLYLISQSVNNNWDTFDSAVVTAEDEVEASYVYPMRQDYDVYWDIQKNTWVWNTSRGDTLLYSASSWTTPDNVVVKYLGETDLQAGLTVVSSFNAG